MGKFTRYLSVALVSFIFLFGFTQLPDYLLYTLERDYPVNDNHHGSLAPVGIIVLGGSVLAHMQMRRDWYHLNEAGERLIEGIALARQYPDAVLIYSGGNAAIDFDGGVEAHAFKIAQKRMSELSNKIILETKSLNTWQNAVYSKALISDMKPGTWLLVTSAFHMKRSIAVFEKVGINVQAWPTDYRASVLRFPWLTPRSLSQLGKLRTYIHEVLGIFVYRLTGRA